MLWLMILDILSLMTLNGHGLLNPTLIMQTLVLSLVEL